MEKFSENQVKVETIVRQFGSSGTLLGHWLLVDAILARLDGCSAQDALRRAADAHGISVALARSRLCGVICYLEKARAGRYVELWGGKRPTPAQLIETIAAQAQP